MLRLVIDIITLLCTTIPQNYEGSKHEEKAYITISIEMISPKHDSFKNSAPEMIIFHGKPTFSLDSGYLIYSSISDEI